MRSVTTLGLFAVVLAVLVGLPPGGASAQDVSAVLDANPAPGDQGATVVPVVPPDGMVSMEVRGPKEEVLRTLAAVPGVEECLPGSDPGEGLTACRLRCGPGEDRREALAAAVAEKGWGLRELHFERVSLEDVFHDLTGKEES